MQIPWITSPALRLLACAAAVTFAAPAAAAPGDLDITFNNGGTLTKDLAGGDDFGAAVVIQPDGNIVIAGSGTYGSTPNFSLARFTPNGTLDTTFNQGGTTPGPGIQSDPVGVCPCGAQALALQSDGKILAAGYAGSGSDLDFVIARYNTDGTLDTDTFNILGNQPGVNMTAVGSATDQAEALALQADGSVVVAGFSDNGANSDFAMTRYNKDGLLDVLLFGTSGIVTTDVSGADDKAFAAAIQPDGKILLAGYATNADTDFAVARYTGNGVLDTTFNPGGAKPGTISTDFGAGNDVAQGIVVQMDGKIVVAGSADDGAGGNFALARYNSDGTPDTTFGSGGTVTTDFSGGADKAYAVAIQPDGKIVAAGYATSSGRSYFAIARYNSDGSLDDTFNHGGSKPGTLVTAVGASNSTAKALALQPDGALVLAGYAYNATNNNNDFAAARYAAVDAAWGVTPDAFTFTDIAQVAVPGEVETSNTITVSGLGTGIHVPVLVSGGEYAINGSTSYTALPGWVQNGDTLDARHTAISGESDTTLTVGGLMVPNNNMVASGTTVSDTFSSTGLSSSGGGSLGIMSLAFLLAGLIVRRH